MDRTVAYQGATGAFGDEACRLFLPDHRRIPVPTFAGVVETVLAGTADRGMLPVENNIAGPVPGMSALLATPGIVGELRTMPVRLHLMAITGVVLDEIDAIASHPVALAQCTKLIARMGAEARPAENTAVAARALAATGDRSLAVVASEAAAAAYGLTILVRDVQDRADNATDFCIIAREPRE